MAYDGTQIVSRAFSVTNIVGTATGATLIFTPTSTFTPLSIIFELVSISGFAVVASCSVGTNGASYNNLLPISSLTGLSNANNFIQYSLTALISTVAAGTGIYVNVTTGAVATTYVLKVTVLGLYN